MSFSVIAPAALRTMFTRTSSCGSFSRASDRAPERALHVGLDDQVQLGDLGALRPDASALERRRAARRRARPRGPSPRAPDATWRASRSSSTSRNVVARVRHRAPPEDLHGLARDRPASTAARSRPASRGSCSTRCPTDEGVAHRRACRAARAPWRPARGPCRGAPRCTVPRAWPVGIALQLLEVGHQQDRLEQGVEVDLRALAETSTNSTVPPHSDGTTPCSTIWCAHGSGRPPPCRSC